MAQERMLSMDDVSQPQHDDAEVNSLGRPAPVSCQVIDFASADVLYDSILGYPAVVVHGEKPYQAMTVEARPLEYVRKPEYWGYEIVGCLPENGGIPTVTGPYVLVVPLPGAAIGTEGVEIIGASTTQALDIDMGKAGHTHDH
jgi:hypothetical protein